MYIALFKACNIAREMRAEIYALHTAIVMQADISTAYPNPTLQCNNSRNSRALGYASSTRMP